ncbi:MAG: hypothetical protein AAGD40_09635 [Pseudomonadota bacterium]
MPETFEGRGRQQRDLGMFVMRPYGVERRQRLDEIAQRAQFYDKDLLAQRTASRR